MVDHVARIACEPRLVLLPERWFMYFHAHGGTENTGNFILVDVIRYYPRLVLKSSHLYSRGNEIRHAYIEGHIWTCTWRLCTGNPFCIMVRIRQQDRDRLKASLCRDLDWVVYVYHRPVDCIQNWDSKRNFVQWFQLWRRQTQAYLTHPVARAWFTEQECGQFIGARAWSPVIQSARFSPQQRYPCVCCRCTLPWWWMLTTPLHLERRPGAAMYPTMYCQVNAPYSTENKRKMTLPRLVVRDSSSACKTNATSRIESTFSWAPGAPLYPTPQYLLRRGATRGRSCTSPAYSICPRAAPKQQTEMNKAF